MPQLRSFSSYANVAPVVLFDHPCDLVSLDGTVAGVGYLQIFDLAVAPTSTVTVPLKSFKVSAAGPLPSIFQTLGPIHLLNGLAVAYSSTEAVYTADATSYDAFGEIEEFEIDNTVGATIVGDTTTGVDALTVWANGATTQGLNSLRRLRADNQNSAGDFLMLFAHSPSNGDIPIRQWSLPLGVTLFNFGTSGFFPFAKTAAGVKRDGCYFAVSSTTGTLTLTANNAWYLKAWYV